MKNNTSFGLNCDKHGGPSQHLAEEMVYWQDIDVDSVFESLYQNSGPSQKYLTFELDEAQLNNIRLAMETVVVLAIAMGRTLVLSPEAEEIFPFDSVLEKRPYLRVITLKEFLEQEAMTGNLRDNYGYVRFPPGNRTEYNEDTANNTWVPYLQKVIPTLKWNEQKCVAAFPSKPGPGSDERLLDYLKAALAHNGSRIESYTNRPNPLDASPQERLREMFLLRSSLCLYDQKLQNTKYLHKRGSGEFRMLTHFYAFIFFEVGSVDVALIDNPPSHLAKPCLNPRTHFLC